MISKENDTEKIERYIKGEASELEKLFVEKLFIDGENNDYLRQCIGKDWDSIPKENPEYDNNLNRLLDSIHHEIRKKEFREKQKTFRKITGIYTRVAAVLLIPLLLTGAITYIVFFHQTQVLVRENAISEIFAPMGSRVTFSLPDGTSGVLNGGSKLKYSIPFVNNRNVSIEGEAWFDVHHDMLHPFLISAGKSNVKVTGTSFNISAYPNENFVEVVLQKGEVRFSDKKGDREITILPSERLIFRNGQIKKNIVDPEKYKGWTEGKLIFRSDPMNEVTRRLERWYNVKITLADVGLEKYSFRATFKDDKLEDVIKYLAMTSPITYKVLPRKLLPDGTYQKEEIIIYRK